VLFIVHQGLGVHIYDFPAYLTFEFNGQVLTRTFWFYPPFLILGLCVTVARPSWNAANIGLVLLFIVTVIVSYTRSEFLVAATVIFIVLGLRLLKERRPTLFLRRLSTIGAVLALVAVIMLVALPAQASYFLSRMASVTHASTIVGDEDLLARQVGLHTVASTVWDSSYAVVGSPFGGAEDAAAQVNTWTADTTWVGVVYWTGVAGVLLIGALFVCYGLRALGLFLHSQETGSEVLGVVLFAMVIATFITSFFSWTFLNTFTYPMGFWLFAFIAGEASKRPISRNARGESATLLQGQTP
jgi:O-antigen ligase